MTVLYFLQRNAGGLIVTLTAARGTERPANCNEACCLNRDQSRQAGLSSLLSLTVREDFRNKEIPAARYLFIFVQFVSLIMRWQMHVMVGRESVSVKAVLE